MSHRTVDPSAVSAARKTFCQICGRTQGLHNHHIIYRSHGGGDDPNNLITLCFECHDKVHRRVISIDQLKLLAKEPPPFDAVVQAYCEGREQEDSGKWLQASAMVICKHGYNWSNRRIASELGLSSSAVRDMVRTFLAFPEESMRAKDLSFTHHRYAAMTDDPEWWLEQSIINGWSSRQLQEQIKRSKMSREAEKDYLLGKAEKALRLVSEVLVEGGEPANWLQNELEKLLFQTAAVPLTA